MVGCCCRLRRRRRRIGTTQSSSTSATVVVVVVVILSFPQLSVAFCFRADLLRRYRRRLREQIRFDRFTERDCGDSECLSCLKRDEQHEKCTGERRDRQCPGRKSSRRFDLLEEMGIGLKHRLPQRNVLVAGERCLQPRRFELFLHPFHPNVHPRLQLRMIPVQLPQRPRHPTKHVLVPRHRRITTTATKRHHPSQIISLQQKILQRSCEHPFNINHKRPNKVGKQTPNSKSDTKTQTFVHHL